MINLQEDLTAGLYCRKFVNFFLCQQLMNYANNLVNDLCCLTLIHTFKEHLL